MICSFHSKMQIFPQIIKLILWTLTHCGGLLHLSRTLALRRSKGTGWQLGGQEDRRPCEKSNKARGPPLSSRRRSLATLKAGDQGPGLICQTTRTRRPWTVLRPLHYTAFFFERTHFSRSYQFIVKCLQAYFVIHIPTNASERLEQVLYLYTVCMSEK